MMDLEQKLYFRDQFRAARAKALKDAECFDELIHCLERLGSYLTSDETGLHSYRSAIGKIAVSSPLAEEIPTQLQAYHLPFDELYESVRTGRNEAVHEGAAARHLTTHAVELSLILEDGLMTGTTRARDYMVPSPTTANPWEPVSFVRQKMLLNSYSFVPVAPSAVTGGSWKLLSDRAVVRYLRGRSGKSLSKKERQRRLARSIEEAIAEYGLEVEQVTCCSPTDSISEVLTGLNHVPVLVCEDGAPERLIGIITAFDLL